MAEATVCGSTWGTGTEPHNYRSRSEEHTSELQSRSDLVCRLLLEKKKQQTSDPPPKPVIKDSNSAGPPRLTNPAAYSQVNTAKTGETPSLIAMRHMANIAAMKAQT